MRDLELPCLGALTWPWSQLSGPERGEGYRFLALRCPTCVRKLKADWNSYGWPP